MSTNSHLPLTNMTADNSSKQSPPSLSRKAKRDLLKQAEEYLPAVVHMISGCRSSEKSIDCGNVKRRGVKLTKRERAERASGGHYVAGGATTSCLLKALYEHDDETGSSSIITYKELLDNVRRRLRKAGYQHVPQLTSSRPIRDEDEFQISAKTTHHQRWGGGGGNRKGNKRALVIAINYPDCPWHLPGSHNDAWNMIKYLQEVESFKGENITILMDDGKYKEPNHTNLKRALHRFCFSLKTGDTGFFFFSGHGTKNANGNGYCIVPSDFQYNQLNVVDNEIFRLLLAPLPKGVKLTCVVDCCHSGNIMDLPFRAGSNRYQSRFRHSKHIGMERRRIDAMKSIGLPAIDLEATLLQTTSNWRDSIATEEFGNYTEPEDATSTASDSTSKGSSSCFMSGFSLCRVKKKSKDDDEGDYDSRNASKTDDKATNASMGINITDGSTGSKSKGSQSSSRSQGSFNSIMTDPSKKRQERKKDAIRKKDKAKTDVQTISTTHEQKLSSSEHGRDIVSTSPVAGRKRFSGHDGNNATGCKLTKHKPLKKKNDPLVARSEHGMPIRKHKPRAVGEFVPAASPLEDSSTHSKKTKLSSGTWSSPGTKKKHFPKKHLPGSLSSSSLHSLPKKHFPRNKKHMPGSLDSSSMHSLKKHPPRTLTTPPVQIRVKHLPGMGSVAK